MFLSRNVNPERLDMPKTIKEQVENASPPIFPTSYAKAVVDHANHKRRRGRKPSMSFLEERNPLRALKLAQSILKSPDGVTQRRLQQLSQYLPKQRQIVYDFAAYVANNYRGVFTPQGFVMVAAAALLDLQKGVSGWTGNPVDNYLVNLTSDTYRVIEKAIPKIAEAIFPADFARIVKQDWGPFIRPPKGSGRRRGTAQLQIV